MGCSGGAAPRHEDRDFATLLWAIEIFVVEGFVFVVGGRELAFDEEVADVGGELQRDRRW